MTSPRVPDRDAVESAVRRRLMTAATVLLPDMDSSLSTADVVHELALSVKADPHLDRVWLLFTALAGAFPEPGHVRELARSLDMSTDGGVMVAALGATIEVAGRAGGSLRAMDLVVGGTVVDVNFCATYEHNTGIQRVVRETIPRWVDAGRSVRLVAWSSNSSSMRDLDDIELDRVLHWNDRQRPEPVDPPDDAIETMVVPWRSNLFLPEVPFGDLCSTLAAIAEYSGNRVTAIGYDAIPLVSAEGQRPEESERFAHYLAVVKHATRVVAISESAAEEFRGYVDALAAQGLVGPEVDAVPLAVEVPAEARRSRPHDSGKPVVVCIGSHEPRKNQEAVLAAAELLHREGIAFEMVFVGGGSKGITAPFDAHAARLRARGFAVRSLRGIPDSELWGLFAAARFTVFVSLHEGFGLPVAESLALGVPVLTSNFGSLAEIAAMGGCVTVNPRDDDAIRDGMRQMLTDGELIARLRREAAAVPPRTWRDYADELWDTAMLDEVLPA